MENIKEQSEFDKLMGIEYVGVKGQAAIDKLITEKQGYIKKHFIILT